MPIGQIQSRSELIGTQVFDYQTLNNTGIASKQIRPVDLAGQPGGSGSGGLSLPKTGSVINAGESGSTFKSGITSDKVESLDQVQSTGKSISLGTSSTGSGYSLQVADPKSGGLSLSPEFQTYTSVGKLTSEASLATGKILNAVA